MRLLAAFMALDCKRPFGDHAGRYTAPRTIAVWMPALLPRSPRGALAGIGVLGCFALRLLGEGCPAAQLDAWSGQSLTLLLCRRTDMLPSSLIVPTLVEPSLLSAH